MCDALRILTVEDEAPIMLQLEATIEDQGHKVVGTAMSSRDAIERIKSTPLDLVLVDLNLVDGRNGLDVARCALKGAVDIVFMTANPLQLAGFDGALGILAKPFSRAAITASLQFVAGCIEDPPPKVPRPPEFSIAAALAERAGIANLGGRCSLLSSGLSEMRGSDRRESCLTRRRGTSVLKTSTQILG